MAGNNGTGHAVMGQAAMAGARTPPGALQDEGQRRLAVLIDADNAQASVIDGLLGEVAKYGIASVKRIYGNFTSTSLQSWKSVLLEHSIQPVQQFAYTTGKNATDSSLIIDAMDLMYTRRFDGFCLVSSDSDFTRLAQRLREEGLLVYGFGEKKTPDAFRKACDKFIFTEVLRPVESARPAPAAAKPPPKKATKGTTARSAASAKAPPAPNAPPSPASTAPEVGERAAALPLRLLRQAIDQASDDAGWANLGAVGNYVNKVQPDFDARLYGCKKLSDLFRKHAQLFQVEERVQGASRALFVRAVE
jgi:hypothetical protein